MSNEPYPIGTEVEYTVRGRVEGDGTECLMIRLPNGKQVWLRTTDGTVRVTRRVLSAGQVWKTREGHEFFVRISRRDIDFRLTPSDLSDEGGLKTMEAKAFFETFPDARLVREGDDASPANRAYRQARQMSDGNAALDALREKLKRTTDPYGAPGGTDLTEVLLNGKR